MDSKIRTIGVGQDRPNLLRQCEQLDVCLKDIANHLEEMIGSEPQSEEKAPLSDGALLCQLAAALDDAIRAANYCARLAEQAVAAI